MVHVTHREKKITKTMDYYNSFEHHDYKCLCSRCLALLLELSATVIAAFVYHRQVVVCKIKTNIVYLQVHLSLMNAVDS